MRQIDASDYPEDCNKLRELFPLLRTLPDLPLELMYQDWCAKVYDSDHVVLNVEHAAEFYEWLFSEMPKV